MATKLRLQRQGRKARPFYHIVAADARSPRDGKKIQKLGIYNPNTNPATIDLNFDEALNWMLNGAQPTDTVRSILSYKGVMYKKHLIEGVKKGALTEEQVEERFNAWLEDKENRINSKSEAVSKAKTDAQTKALAAETEVNNKRAAALAAKNAPVVEETEAAPEATEEVVEEESIDDAAAQAEEETK